MLHAKLILYIVLGIFKSFVRFCLLIVCQNSYRQKQIFFFLCYHGNEVDHAF